MCQQKTKGRLEEWMHKIDKTIRDLGSVSKNMSGRNPKKITSQNFDRSEHVCNFR